jgi:hypothetical protein
MEQLCTTNEISMKEQDLKAAACELNAIISMDFTLIQRQ